MKQEVVERLFWYTGWVYDFTKYATLVIVLGVIVHYFFFSILIVRGSSMIPNHNDGSVMLINKLSYQTGSPERGDVVGMFFPGETQKRFVKRIIGLPGETISISQGQVFINGRILTEEYLSPSTISYPSLEKKLQEGEYFVMGDNRISSSDSRAWGPVPESFIVGEALFNLFSLPANFLTD